MRHARVLTNVPFIKLSALFLTMWACSGQLAAATETFSFEGKSLRLQSAAPAALLELSPTIKISGQWLAPASDADCGATERGYRCRLGDVGEFILTKDGDRLELRFEAAREVNLQALGLQGHLQIPEAKAWLSNGFQSWSQTGVISLKGAPKEADLQSALALTGEDEVYRRGAELSWWYSFVGNDRISLLAGASTADNFRSWIQFSKAAGDQVAVQLISGAGEQVTLAAGESIAETWFLALGSDLQQHMDRYAKTLESRRTQKPVSTLAGWNSWYDLWDKVNEKDFLANAQLVQELWAPRLTSTASKISVILDDGWEKKWGDWQTNDKFPSGLEALAQNLARRSQRFGIWIAPLLAHPDSEVVRQHPDWFVQGASYRNPMGTEFKVLDITQAAVAEHLQSTMKRLTQAGAKVIKIDFLFAGALEGTRSKNLTGMQAYHEAMRLIREAVGEEVELYAVGAPPLATLKYVDGWRVGGDIAFAPVVLGLPKPGSTFIANQARSLAGRQPYCQITLCDADPALLRALSRDEVEAGAWVATAAGGAMVLSDNLQKLDRQRLTWGYTAQQLKNGLSGRPARLLSYFPPEIPNDLNSMKDRLFTAEQKVPELWILPDGTRVALNFGNAKKVIGGVQVPKNAARVIP